MRSLKLSVHDLDPCVERFAGDQCRDGRPQRMNKIEVCVKKFRDGNGT